MTQSFVECEVEETVGQAAERLYPGLTFDAALPQHWVDKVLQRTGDNPVGHVIMLYPECDPPYVAPITMEGVHILGFMAAYI